MLLVHEVVRRLGAGRVRQGLRLTEVEHSGGGGPEVARFVNESGGKVVLEADLVVAADGIHSAVRSRHHPDEGAPAWNGLILWRGTALVPEYLDGRTMIMAGDGEQKFVATR